MGEVMSTRYRYNILQVHYEKDENKYQYQYFWTAGDFPLRYKFESCIRVVLDEREIYHSSSLSAFMSTEFTPSHR